MEQMENLPVVVDATEGYPGGCLVEGEGLPGGKFVYCKKMKLLPGFISLEGVKRQAFVKSTVPVEPYFYVQCRAILHSREEQKKVAHFLECDNVLVKPGVVKQAVSFSTNGSTIVDSVFSPSWLGVDREAALKQANSEQEAYNKQVLLDNTKVRKEGEKHFRDDKAKDMAAAEFEDKSWWDKRKARSVVFNWCSEKDQEIYIRDGSSTFKWRMAARWIDRRKDELAATIDVSEYYDRVTQLSAEHGIKFS